eukprot:TRINITY_DN29219_c0_g2_i3.p1 TRINITY_DN29219_c0_g2~~TRINITY_DN29219_c0_g2_i3.p1  ORF type:complete len:136 (-),score=7.17 TRINITY_DN29219_c0_g2_i3:115-522(-)
MPRTASRSFLFASSFSMAVFSFLHSFLSLCVILKWYVAAFSCVLEECRFSLQMPEPGSQQLPRKVSTLFRHCTARAGLKVYLTKPLDERTQVHVTHACACLPGCRCFASGPEGVRSTAHGKRGGFVLATSKDALK